MAKGLNILFVHQNMPGQFKHLAPKFAANPKNKVAFITKREGVDIPGVRRVNYQIPRTAKETTHHYVRLFENSVIYGQQTVRACHDLHKDGFRPDVIVAHPGWGEALFLKDNFIIAAAAPTSASIPRRRRASTTSSGRGRAMPICCSAWKAAMPASRRRNGRENPIRPSSSPRSRPSSTASTRII
jgi:hypothetical protein